MTLLDADVREQRHVLGEDTFDLFATIEDSFGVTFPDYESILGKSVKELAELIASESIHPKSDRCLSLVVFCALRRTFTEVVGTPRGRIRPDACVAELLSWKDRRRHWRLLQEELHLNLPTLQWPVWLLALTLLFAIASAMALSVGVKAIIGSGLGLPGVVLASFAIWVIALKWLDPLARGIPAGCETFGDLTKAVVALNYATISSRYGGTSQEEIASLLSRLIALEVGLSATEVTHTTRIPGDLNIE